MTSPALASAAGNHRGAFSNRAFGAQAVFELEATPGRAGACEAWSYVASGGPNCVGAAPADLRVCLQRVAGPGRVRPLGDDVKMRSMTDHAGSEVPRRTGFFDRSIRLFGLPQDRR